MIVYVIRDKNTGLYIHNARLEYYPLVSDQGTAWRLHQVFNKRGIGSDKGWQDECDLEVIECNLRETKMKMMKEYFLTWNDGKSKTIYAPNKTAAIIMCRKGDPYTIDEIN